MKRLFLLVVRSATETAIAETDVVRVLVIHP
jgi:hypothetical protein